MTQNIQILDENTQIKVRKEKLQKYKDLKQDYRNDFTNNILSLDLHKKYGKYSKQELQELENKSLYKIAGRIMLRRVMGKAGFLTIQDKDGKIQVYIKKSSLPQGVFAEFKNNFDLGDIVGICGTIFKTNTGELSLNASNLFLLTKALRPLPDKFHGLTDTEVKYRQRYLDLIINEESKNKFILRTKIIQYIRNFFLQNDYLEVETPMMHTLAGGAAAKPFKTHHNALDIPLFLRIAPELYLKRLVIGGFDRVFEINRNFRNEGLSTRHNPEFTMLEFYQAYATYEDLIILTEKLIQGICKNIMNTFIINYQGMEYDFSKPFHKLKMSDAILQYNKDLTREDLFNLDFLKDYAETKLGIKITKSMGLGKIQTEIFEATVEENLIEATFITEYPFEVSPLARRNNDNPFITDRFEFFIGGREIANGFSELNDPEDQALRFQKQMESKDFGDDEAMPFDNDYIKALEYGLPPTAGEGIGIDRLAMIFTDSSSIKDVILFPHMKPL